MKFYFNENKLSRALCDISLLQEGKDRKQQARHKTKNVIRDYFKGYNVDEPNENTNGMSLVDFLEQECIHNFFHSRERQDAKGYFIVLEPMVMRILLNAGWHQDRNDNGVIAQLQRILNYIESQYNQGKLDIRSIPLDSTIDDLNHMFGGTIKSIRDTEENELGNTEFTVNDDYEILDGVDYEDAYEIGDYTCSESPLCYTQSEDIWEKFTDGYKNKVYVLLRKGYKDIEEIHSETLLSQYNDGESTAYDEYGLSIIFLFVTPDGDLAYSNTRWNHEADYGNSHSVDHAFTKMDISKLVGVNFNDRFKGYSVEELNEMGIRYITFETADMMLKQGANPKDVFDSIESFINGFAKVRLNDKCNFISRDNKLLSNQWFDYVSNFNDGFADVCLNKKWNLINQDGEFLYNKWVDNADNLREGFAKGEYNKIDTDDQLYNKKRNNIIEQKANNSKKIYINENSIESIVKSKLLPQFLFKMVKGHNTSLGDNDAFPTSGDYPFDYIILKQRFSDVCEAIEGLSLEALDEDYLMSELSSLVTECKRLETPIRDTLERICENAVNKLFAIPQESINMSFKLVDKIKFKSAIRMRPESDESLDFSFKDIADIDLSNKAIGKRRFINALIQGASYTYSGIEGLYIDDIDKVNHELPRLYRKIRIINDYLLFIKKEEMSDDKPMQGSYVETHLGLDGSKTTIKAQGIIFPLLLQESIKGLFELFSSHGLPKDRGKAQYIVKKADFVLSEPWDLRLGVNLWRMIFGGVEDINMIPYMFTSFVKLPTDKFNECAKEILSKTEKGREIIQDLMRNAEYDNGYQQFTNRINAKNLDKSLIKDSYFSGAETNGYELDSEDDNGDVIEEVDV